MAEAPDLAAAREMVLAQLTRTIDKSLDVGDLVERVSSEDLARVARAAAEAVLGQGVLLPPGWSLEWLKDPQERIPVAQAEPVAYPTAGRAAGLIRYHLQNADIGPADRAELAAFADALDATRENSLNGRRRHNALVDLEGALTLALQAMAENDCCADPDNPDWRGPAIDEFRADLRALGVSEAELDEAGIRV